MRDGLSLTDQAIAYGGGALSEDAVRADAGQRRPRPCGARCVEALAARDGAARAGRRRRSAQSGLSAAGTLEEMARAAAADGREQAVPGALDAHDPDDRSARALAGCLAADETQLLYSMALHGRDELALMSDEYGALTMVLLRFLAFRAGRRARRRSRAPSGGRAAPEAGGRSARRARRARVPLARRAAARRAARGRRRQPAAVPPAAPAPRRRRSPRPARAEAPPRAGTVRPGSRALGDRWYAAVKLLRRRRLVSGLARELAMQADLHRVDDQHAAALALACRARDACAHRRCATSWRPRCRGAGPRGAARARSRRRRRHAGTSATLPSASAARRPQRLDRQPTRWSASCCRSSTRRASCRGRSSRFESKETP